MSGQATSGSVCAAWLQRTGATVATRSSIHDVTVFIIGVLAQQPLVVRADICIAVRFIAELLAPEQFAIALIINCAHDGNMRGCFEFCVKRLFLDTGGTDGNRERANR